MKKFLFIVSIACGFIACKKDHDVEVINNPTTTTAKIKTSTNGALSVTHTYDSQGKVVKEEYSGGTWVEYEYLPGIVNEKSYNNAGVLQGTYTNEVNADGVRTRTTISSYPGYEELCFYNPDYSILKTLTNSNVSDAHDFYFSNGNLDSVRLSTYGNWSQTTIYTYYTDKPNVLSYENYGYHVLYGKDNKNMLKAEITKYSDGSSTTPSNHTYEYDAHDRVSKETITNGNNIGVTLYTYY